MPTFVWNRVTHVDEWHSGRPVTGQTIHTVHTSRQSGTAGGHFHSQSSAWQSRGEDWKWTLEKIERERKAEADDWKRNLEQAQEMCNAKVKQAQEACKGQLAEAEQHFEEKLKASEQRWNKKVVDTGSEVTEAWKSLLKMEKDRWKKIRCAARLSYENGKQLAEFTWGQMFKESEKAWQNKLESYECFWRKTHERAATEYASNLSIERASKRSTEEALKVCQAKNVQALKELELYKSKLAQQQLEAKFRLAKQQLEAEFKESVLQQGLAAQDERLASDQLRQQKEHDERERRLAEQSESQAQQKLLLEQALSKVHQMTEAAAQDQMHKATIMEALSAAKLRNDSLLEEVLSLSRDNRQIQNRLFEILNRQLQEAEVGSSARLSSLRCKPASSFAAQTSRQSGIIAEKSKPGFASEHTPGLQEKRTHAELTPNATDPTAPLVKHVAEQHSEPKPDHTGASPLVPSPVKGSQLAAAMPCNEPAETQLQPLSAINHSLELAHVSGMMKIGTSSSGDDSVQPTQLDDDQLMERFSMPQQDPVVDPHFQEQLARCIHLASDLSLEVQPEAEMHQPLRPFSQAVSFLLAEPQPSQTEEAAAPEVLVNVQGEAERRVDEGQLDAIEAGAIIDNEEVQNQATRLEWQPNLELSSNGRTQSVEMPTLAMMHNESFLENGDTLENLSSDEDSSEGSFVHVA